MKIKKNTLHKAAFLMLVTRFAVKVLGLVSSLVLVRILTPQDFGVIAVAMSVYSFVQIFGLFGFNNALIQRTKVTIKDFNVAFTYNFTFGLLAFLLLFLSSSSLANFLDDVRLKELFKYVSIMFLVNGINNVKIIEFQKNMNFEKELVFQFLPKFFSFIITLTLVYMMKNYMALVYGMLLDSLIIAFFSYAMKPYLPRLTFKGAKKLFGYSKWLMLNSVLFYVNNHSINFIVGKFISTRATGLYSIGQEIAMLPLGEIAGPINKASFAAYSNAQHHIEELTRLFTETTSLIVYLALPASAGLFIVSEYFVPVVLGERWNDAIPIIQYLSIISLVATFSANSGYIFMAIGKPKITFFVALFRAILFILSMVLLVDKQDYTSVAKAMFIATFIATLMSFYVIKTSAHLSLRPLIKSVVRPVTSAFIMCLGLTILDVFLVEDGFSIEKILLIEVVFGVVCYISSLFTLWHLGGRNEGVESILLSKVNMKR